MAASLITPDVSGSSSSRTSSSVETIPGERKCAPSLSNETLHHGRTSAVAPVSQHTDSTSAHVPEGDATAAHIAPRWPGLTPAETRVAELLALGATCREIAALVGCALKTVDTHRLHVLKKLGLGSQALLVRYAIRNGLVSPEAGPYDPMEAP